MKLLLSSEALPQASFDVLVEACRRRALAGLELTLGRGYAHGIDASLCPIRQQEGIGCIPRDGAAPVVWLRLPEDASSAMVMTWAGEAHLLGAGLLLARAVADPPLALRVALVHGTSVAEAREAVNWAERYDARTCWQVDPDRRDPAVRDEVSQITGPRLAHVRILGAGPEAQKEMPGTSGTGSLLSRLALRGYDGSVAFAPSSSDHRELWERWLLADRGWGCGTAAEKQARTSHHQPANQYE